MGGWLDGALSGSRSSNLVRPETDYLKVCPPVQCSGKAARRDVHRI